MQHNCTDIPPLCCAELKRVINDNGGWVQRCKWVKVTLPLAGTLPCWEISFVLGQVLNSWTRNGSERSFRNGPHRILVSPDQPITDRWHVREREMRSLRTMREQLWWQSSKITEAISNHVASKWDENWLKPILIKTFTVSCGSGAMPCDRRAALHSRVSLIICFKSFCLKEIATKEGNCDHTVSCTSGVRFKLHP